MKVMSKEKGLQEFIGFGRTIVLHENKRLCKVPLNKVHKLNTGIKSFTAKKMSKSASIRQEDLCGSCI